MSKYTFLQRKHTDDQKAHEKCSTLLTKSKLITIFIILINNNSNKFYFNNFLIIFIVFINRIYFLF